MKLYDPDRLMQEFYTSRYYDPLADRPADNVKYAIEFMIEWFKDDLRNLSECAQELSQCVPNREVLSNKTEITLDRAHDILKED